MPDIPAPPATYSDPAAIVGWIAVALVVCAVVAIGALVHTLRSERREALAAFREECKMERDAHAASVADLRESHEKSVEKITARLDAQHTALVAIEANTRP